MDISCFFYVFIVLSSLCWLVCWLTSVVVLVPMTKGVDLVMMLPRVLDNGTWEVQKKLLFGDLLDQWVFRLKCRCFEPIEEEHSIETLRKRAALNDQVTGELSKYCPLGSRNILV